MPFDLSPSALILVAIIKSPHDLEIAKMLGWYRIPLRSAPKVIAVDYLAFYQTGAFGKDRWRINYIAQVKGHELARRDELFKDAPDHPHAQHEYYKIQIGPLIPLPNPILAMEWKRITFLYTTGEYLLAAKTMHDLVVHPNERLVLWQALRERAQQDNSYQSLETTDFDLDEEALKKLFGLL